MRSLTLVVTLLCGCDLLFPEFSGSTPTTSTDGGSDAGSTPHISGVLCALTDLRDFRTCTGITSATQLRVTVEETRDEAAADSSGHFTLPLSKTLPTALLAGADATNNFLPTVTTVPLTGGSADGVVVPLAPAQSLQQLALENGIVLDAQKGIIFGWVTNSSGAALAGVTATAPAGADGPFYDGPQAGDVEPGRSTSTRGLVAFFNVAAGNASFTVGQTEFVLPVRQNALTFSLLVFTTP